MRYLITGGLGVVGSRITKRLMDEGHSVTVIDAAEAPRNHWIKSNIVPRSRAITMRLESYSPQLLSERIADVDAVIHAAASTGIPHSVLHPDDDWRSNVDATRVLLEALRICPKPAVVLSSVKPYRVEGNGCLDELAPLEPDEPYAASKAAQSMLAMAYAKSYGLPVVTFRCSNLYGPAPCHGPRHGWLTWFAICAAIGRPLEVQGSGTQSRDMLHADDVYSACMVAIESAVRLSGRVFNIGGGLQNRISVADAASLFREWSDCQIASAPPRAMDDLHVYANYGAFLRSTGWHPLVNVRDGMRLVFGWAVENRDTLRKLYEGA